jgi:hypothetical protein
MYRENREWGAKLQLGTNTYIFINADQNKIMEILTDKNNRIS